MARPDAPKMSVATVDSLINASSNSFSTRCLCRERSSVKSEAQAGVVTELADLRRRDEPRSQHAPLVELGQPHGVDLVGLGTARHLLDVAGVDQPGVQPTSLGTGTRTDAVVRRGLHHDPLNTRCGEFVSQRQDGVGGRPHLHTLVTRRPGIDRWGTRVHTVPDALATSIAATRSTICSIYLRRRTPRRLVSSHSPPRLPLGHRWAGRGPRSGTEILIRALAATMRDPSRSDPGARLRYGLKTTEASASRPARTIFTSARCHRQGHED